MKFVGQLITNAIGFLLFVGIPLALLNILHGVMK
jgi:hypothetical protein